MAAVTAVPLVAGVSSIMGSAPAGALAMAADISYVSCFAFFDNRKPTNSWSGRAKGTNSREIPGILWGEMEQRNAADEWTTAKNNEVRIYYVLVAGVCV